jgi:hypothetical protein
VFRSLDGKGLGRPKAWVQKGLGCPKAWVQGSLTGPGIQSLDFDTRVENLGSRKARVYQCFFLLSGFTGVAWKPVGELYWVMLEWVLNDPAGPLPPFLPCLRSMCRIDWEFLGRGTLLGNVGVGVQCPACAFSPRSLPFHSRSLRSLLLLGSWMGFVGISD